MSRRRAAPKFRGGLGSSGPRTDSGVWVGRGPDGLWGRIRASYAALLPGVFTLCTRGGGARFGGAGAGSVPPGRYGPGGFGRCYLMPSAAHLAARSAVQRSAAL